MKYEGGLTILLHTKATINHSVTNTLVGRITSVG